MRAERAVALAVTAVVVAGVGAAWVPGWVPGDRVGRSEPRALPGAAAVAAPGPPRPVAPAPARLVPWHGPVEQIFVHPLVLRPRLAFTDDARGRGFADHFVTAREFRVLLDELWRNGWTLVDVHRAASGTVRVPAGRRPVVLVEDDVNYYRYFQGRGLASRLVLGRSGRVRALTASGRPTRLDVVPLVERAVSRHPELSADGAKGVLAGFGIQLDIDIVARRVVGEGVVVMSRRHVDGLAFAAPDRQAPFFDVARVRDPRRPE